MKILLIMLATFLYASGASAGCKIQQTTPTELVTDPDGTYKLTHYGVTNFTANCIPDAGYDTITWAWNVVGHAELNNQNSVSIDPAARAMTFGEHDIALTWEEDTLACESDGNSEGCQRQFGGDAFRYYWGLTPVLSEVDVGTCTYNASTETYSEIVRINSQPSEARSAPPIHYPGGTGIWFYLNPTGTNPDMAPTFVANGDIGVKITMTKPGPYSYSLKISSMNLIGPYDPNYVPGGSFGFFSKNSLPVTFSCVAPKPEPPTQTVAGDPVNGPPADTSGSTGDSGGETTVGGETGTTISNPCGGCATGSTNPASGASYLASSDFSIPGTTRDSSITVARNYTAATGDPTFKGALGANWQLGYETHLNLSSSRSGTIQWLDERGGPNRFTANRDGSFSSPGGQQTKLVALSDHYEIQKPNHTVYSFDKTSGKLTQVVDRHGQATSLEYNSNGTIASISAPFAGSVSFSYSRANLVTQVTRNRDNLTYSYSYDEGSRLVSVTDFNNRTWAYTYVGAPGTPFQGYIASITDPIGRVSKFAYDSSGRVIEKTEPGGGAWKYVYGTQTTTVTAPNGGVTKYFYDANLNEIRRVLPDGSVYNTQYNSAGFKIAEGYELGGLTKYGHDANGNVNSVQRPLDASPTTYVFDQTFNVPTMVTPLVGSPTQFTLDPNSGAVLTQSRAGPNGTVSITYTRDSFGNILSTNNGIVTYADQRDSNGFLTNRFDLHNPVTFTYDSRGRVITQSYQSGRVLQYTYNDDDRVVAIVDSAGPSTTNVYDVMKRLTQRTVSAGGESHVTKMQYDDRDRLVAVTDPLNRTTTFQYDPVHVISKPQSVTDPAGRVTYFQYDKLQRLAQKTDPNGGVTSFTYDQRGNVTSQTDANGNVTRWAYDLNDRKIREDRPSVAGTAAARRVTEYFYDGADHLVREVTKSASGGQDRVIQYTYDSLDRLVRKTALRDGSDAPDDDSIYTYENQLDATLMKTAVNGVSSLSFTNEAAPPFSSSGFTTAASQSGNPLGLITGNFAITRDVTGEISSVSKDGTALFAKSYDSAGRLVGVQAGSFTSALGYDGFGRRIGVQHSDGAVGTFGFDLLDRQVSTSWTGPTPISENLSYDLAGNITQLQRENGTSNLSYDATDQLTGSTGLYSKTFVYDLLGNRVGGSDGTGSVVSNFLLSNGSSSFLADPDGFGDTVKETSGSAVKNYAYRADDLLNAAQSGTTQLAYYFDALKRRVAKVVNLGGTAYTESFLHQGDEDRILMAKAGDGTVTTYIDGQGVDDHLVETKSGISKSYATDHLGSVLNADAAGSGHGFGLFGEGAAPLPSPSSSPVSYGFAGRELDESGLYYNRARNYSPVSGRFLSQDPIGHSSGDENLYRYTMNRPANYSDPSGLFDDGPPLPDPVNNSNICLGNALIPFGQCLFSNPVFKGAGYGRMAMMSACLVLAIDGPAPVVSCLKTVFSASGMAGLPLLGAAVVACMPAFENGYKTCINKTCSEK